MAKELTYDQAAERKRKAEAFLRDVKEDDERADEVGNESVQDYADRRKISNVNSGRSTQKIMAGNGGNGRTKQDLLDEIDDLKLENLDLQDLLDSIADLAAGEPEDVGEDDSEDDDDDDGGRTR